MRSALLMDRKVNTAREKSDECQMTRDKERIIFTRHPTLDTPLSTVAREMIGSRDRMKKGCR
jgi:hypothetical protein